MNIYISQDGSIQLLYVDGIIGGVFVQSDDRIIFDGLKHSISFYEDEIDIKLYRKGGN